MKEKAVPDAAGVTTVLRARGLRKHYGKDAALVRAVDGVDLDVDAGETVAVTGPSGCGKSTLLHLLGGLDRASAGEIWLPGRRVGAAWTTALDARTASALARALGATPRQVGAAIAAEAV